MIILLSNRTVETANSLSDELETDESILHLAKVTNKNPAFTPFFNFEDEFSDDMEAGFDPDIEIISGDVKLNLNRLANEVSASDDKHKAWVFFIHGNNQSIEKNLEKCAILEYTHQVNVVAFSWPSRPPIPLDKSNLMANIFKIIQNPSNLVTYGKVAKKFIDRKQAAYAQARENAKASVLQLANSLTLANDEFFDKIDGTPKKSLLIHSLGNYLAEQFFRRVGSDYSKNWFKHVIFHQGDSDYDLHAEWINDKKIKLCDGNIFITHNRKDSILLASELEKFVYKKEELTEEQRNNSKRRLGRGDGTVLTGDDRVIYLNFTKAPMVSIDHNFFNLSEMANENVNRIMGSILTSQDFDTTVLNNFSTNDGKYFVIEKPDVTSIEDFDDF